MGTHTHTHTHTETHTHTHTWGVIKKKIIEHLEKREKINDGQHGFVPGRSTQTQLLCHYDIYEALTEGKRMDTVFLDFAKAFDKVDHNILLEKVNKHGIGGKIGRWIMEFLRGRKFRVVANGCMPRGRCFIRSPARRVQF